MSTVIKVPRGLTLPLAGEPEQRIYEGPALSQVAWVGTDYPGLRPRLLIKEGERVSVGQPLVQDKDDERLRFPSPGTGKIFAINRGERRRLLSIVIDLEDDDRSLEKTRRPIGVLSGEEFKNLLLESGLWTMIRQRPYDRIAQPDNQARSLFITGHDTNPLAPDLDIIIGEYRKEFNRGLASLVTLVDGPTYLCVARGSEIPTFVEQAVEIREFTGRHPAGNVGTHIHLLDPVRRDRVVWHVMAQDVIAIGHYLETGMFPIERIVSVAGQMVTKPRLIKTRRGASLSELVKNELSDSSARVIAGSVYSGHRAAGPLSYLGAFHQQVSVIAEGGKQEFLGWLLPHFDRFSVTNALFSRIITRKQYNFTTDTWGGERPIIPLGMYEKVMALDILPTPLLRAIIVDDIEMVEKLGGLELVEEDITLLTFVCPSKIDWSPHLRRNLALLEKEG